MKIPRKHLQDLYALLASLKTTKDAQLLVDDLLTPNEKATITQRWQLVKLLASGMTQREISKKLKISISKVTRGSHALQYGSGAFRKLVNRRG
jgi:Trp operon repressor